MVSLQYFTFYQSHFEPHLNMSLTIFFAEKLILHYTNKTRKSLEQKLFEAFH